MLTYDAARAAVVAHLARLEGDRVILEDALTMEYTFGWVFQYADRAYAETGDLAALRPLPPLALLRDTGLIVPLPGKGPIEHRIREFAATPRARQASARLATHPAPVLTPS